MGKSIMGELINFATKRTWRDFGESVIRATELACKIPQCRLVRDFLAARDLPQEAFYMPLALSHEEWKELGDRLIILLDGIEKERSHLRELYEVDDENKLPHDRRALFDAALRAHIEREDHYP